MLIQQGLEIEEDAFESALDQPAQGRYRQVCLAAAGRSDEEQPGLAERSEIRARSRAQRDATLASAVRDTGLSGGRTKLSTDAFSYNGGILARSSIRRSRPHSRTRISQRPKSPRAR